MMAYRKAENIMKRKRAVALLASLAILLTAGCGSSSAGSTGASTSGSASGSTSGTTSSASSSSGGLTIAVANGSEDSMVINTSLAGTLAGLSANRHLFEGLYKLDKDGNLVLGGAAKDEVSEDGLVHTFTLRDDATWSDGQAVTANDYTYGFKHLKEAAGDYSSLLDIFDNYEAVDDKTLKITLKFPCSYLPSILAFPSAYPVREDYVEKYGDSYATDPDKAVYNGPYALTDWTHQASLTLTKRSDYYDAANITVDTINWQLMSDSATMENSFVSGDVVYSDSYSEEDAESLKDKGLHFTSGYNTYCAMFNLDTGNDVLKDAKVRKALSLAIDRTNVQEIRGVNDEIAYTYTPGGLTNESGTEFNSTVTPWYSEDYSANCEEAKKLLAEAGYADGANFPSLKYLVSSGSRQTVAEAIVADWKDVLGIDSITVETSENFFSSREDGDFDIAYFGWYMDYPDISNMLYTMTTGQNDAKYSSADYDEAYNSAVEETDTAKQWELYDKCEEILSNDVPVAPILHSQNSYLFDDTKYTGLVYYCGNSFFGYVTENK